MLETLNFLKRHYYKCFNDLAAGSEIELELLRQLHSDSEKSDDPVVWVTQETPIVLNKKVILS
jgi:hypothetical protein